MRKIGDFELVDHGVDGEQYFQGCGTSYTPFEHCATGCGDSAAEAVDDMLESVAQDDFETEGMEKRIMDDLGLTEFPAGDCCGECEYGDSDDSDDSDEKDAACAECEMHYYVSLRWNADEADEDPQEPGEEDIVIGHDDKTAFYAGKCVVRVDDSDDLRPAIKAWMEEHKCWPDVWTVSDHGNALCVSADVASC